MIKGESLGKTNLYIKAKKELDAVHLHHLHVQPLLLAGEVVAAASPMLPLAHLVVIVVIVVIVVVEGIQKKVEDFSPDCNSFPPTYVQCGQSIALLKKILLQPCCCCLNHDLDLEM